MKLPPSDEDALLHAVANVGPISAALDVHHHSFQFYNYGKILKSTISKVSIYHEVHFCLNMSLRLYFFHFLGVYSGNDCSRDTLNHAVLVVGYDSDPVSGLPYWIVKNR